MPEDCTHCHTPSDTPDRMCLSTLAPAMSRMRHWSCPERLPTSCLDPDDPENFLPPAPRPKEAEDLTDLETFGRVDLRLRVLAAWEERVLSLRQARKSRPRPEAASVTIVREEARSSDNDTVTSSSAPCQPTQPPETRNLTPAPAAPPCDEVKLNLRISQSAESAVPRAAAAVLSVSSENRDPGDPSAQADRGTPSRQTRKEKEIFPSADLRGPRQRLMSENVNCHGSGPGLTQPSGLRESSESERALLTQSPSLICSFEPRLLLMPTSLLLFLCHLLPMLLSLCSSRITSSKSQKLHCKKPPDKRTQLRNGQLSSCLWVTCILLSLVSPGTCINVDQQFPIRLSESLGQASDGPVCADGIHRGNININNKDEHTGMASLVKYENCSVVEGSISITSAVYEMTGFGNYSLPNLVEVTDYVLLYRADEIDSLESLFPKLSVIRGHKLVQFYALAIYQMKNMVRVGLPSLTHIMNGGVRIEKNPLLCYVDTIDWKKIVVQENDKNSHIEIIDNQSPNNCLDKCPDKCSADGCWSSAHCQRVIVPCPEGTDYKDELMCYRNNKGEEGRPCHNECIGGCLDTEDAGDDNNPARCVACNHTRSKAGLDFTCLNTCPGGKVAYKKWMCISEAECSTKSVKGVFEISLLPHDDAKSVYKVHEGECIDKCPSSFKPVRVGNITRCDKCLEGDCPVQCDGEIINSPESAKKLKSCTHINGDLVINVNRGDITNVLEENLQNIVEIMGSLKIERSHSLVSLHFFKSLKKIGGGEFAGATKTLTIFENDNLQKLFPDNQVLDLGTMPVVFIHYNQKLCMKEITKFLDQSRVIEKQRKEHSVSSFSNGNKIVCSEEKLNLNVITGGPDLLKLQYKNYYQVLEGLKNVDVNSLLGYHVFYREVTEEQFANRSITKYEGMDACGGSAWNVIFEEDPARFSMPQLHTNGTPCDPNKETGCIDLGKGSYVKIVYNDVYTYIPNCKPYTPYAIYVTTVMEKTLAGRATGAQSDIVYARTNETNPSPVDSLEAKSPSPNSLEVTWREPNKPNGIIDQYYVEVTYLQSFAANEERNYCDQKKQVLPAPSVPEPPSPSPDEMEDSCPVCDEVCRREDDPAINKPVAPQSDKVIGEKSFHDDIINKVFPLIQSVAIAPEDELYPAPDIFSRKRRSLPDQTKGNSLAEEDSSAKREGNESFITIKSQRHGPFRNLSEANETILSSSYMKRVLVKLPGNVTSVVIDSLRHFTDYEIRVLACHQERLDGGQVYRACSDEAILNTKTTHNNTADNILPWDPSYDKSTTIFTQAGNGTEGIIKWLPPSDPNGRIVNYMLSRSPDPTTKPFIRCISLAEIKKTREKDHKGIERDVMSYVLTTDGEYYIRLQAVSLFDEGSWTEFQFVRVNSNKSSVALVIVLLCFFLLVLGMGLFGGIAYYKRKKGPAGWTKSSTNENYMDSRDIYEPDNWEVKREDVTVLEELGKGSFGMVYRGLYVHPDPEKGELVCAVKTVNERSSFRQKIDFLQEASVMKDYNTEHVIKLIGVVSEGQPALVLMELMENGDLKNYLRSRRPDSENNRLGLDAPTISEVLQMAIDIADGMSYLSVKKIVHRDLAARNCMVSNNVVVKVGDFGMARDIYETEYYRKQGRGLLPVRWMAPESIKDGKFTSQSDVWSFGVVLWEMATLAEQPYQGFTNDEVMKYVKDGNKMKRPENCHDIMFDLMSDCWHILPDERPTFLQICKRLLDKANDRWRATCFFLTPEGKEAVINQEEMLQLRREQEEAVSTPLTSQTPGSGSGTNGVNGGDNGHLAASGDSHQMINFRPNARSPTQVHFSNESSGYHSGSRAGSRPRLSMNGIVARIRNMSGSAGADTSA